MKDYQRILIPTDGSENSELAINRGLDLAKDLKKPVHALYVIDDAPFVDVLRSNTVFLDMQSALQSQAEQTLRGIRNRARKLGLRVDAEIRTGLPAEEIVAAARPADLLVIATHGRRGLSRLLLGSIAESVVRHAPCSVLVVRPNRVSRKRVGP